MKTVKVKGMSCQHCVKSVKKTLEEIDGIANVT
ncbi:MAG: cation transporter, partial [Deltaproteobacteria bacterium]|nr:cation transporter [Deltaproteobacteria bacterium]